MEHSADKQFSTGWPPFPKTIRTVSQSDGNPAKVGKIAALNCSKLVLAKRHLRPEQTVA